ncbi:hypothetical protein V6N13_112689 [Hibiscus sabdariffa]
MKLDLNSTPASVARLLSLDWFAVHCLSWSGETSLSVSNSRASSSTISNGHYLPPAIYGLTVQIQLSGGESFRLDRHLVGSVVALRHIQHRNNSRSFKTFARGGGTE